jgi:hypothetical protein
MPVSRPSDLPVGGGGRWPLCGKGFRSVQWGDLEVGYTTCEPGDHTAAYQGLPGGVCQCPHYGYVFSGRIRCVFPGTDWPDEVAEAGDAYFFPPGHALIYELPTEALELNPAAALQTLMDHFEAVGRARATGAGAAAAPG